MLNYLSAGRSLHANKYRPDIDGIRAIAVTSVVICHAFPFNLPGGFIGVDIFFVISGYLISSILIRDLDRNSFSIAGFYNRRIRRIFPALIVVLLAISLFGWFCLFRPEYLALGQHICASTLFSENFLLWSQAGYFDVSSQMKPTLHLWSLAIEEQFYIFWPILMYIAHRQKINFVLMFAVLGGLSFAINLHDVYTNPTAAYYSPFGRSWELMVGSCLAYIQTRRPDFLRHHPNAQSWTGLVLIVVALVWVGPESNFPGFWALLPTLGSALLISGGGDAWVNRKLLASPPMVWCGLISYPLYLWHWPFLSFATIISTGFLPRTLALACVVASVIAATLTFFFVERPFRQHKKEGPAKTFSLAGVMVGILGLGVIIATQTVPPRLKEFNAPTRTEWSFLQARSSNFDRNGTGIYPLESGRKDLVLFIGDSHVAQYAERLDRTILANPNAPGAVMAIGGQCIPIENVLTNQIKRASCWPLRKQAYEMAEQSRFSTIVIGGAWNDYFLNKGFYTYDAAGARVALTSPAGRDAALQTLGQRIRMLVSSGKRVVFVLDNPLSDTLNPAGSGIRLSLSAKNYRPSTTGRIPDDQVALNQLLYKWAQGTGAVIVNPLAAICTGNTCQVTTATGQPIYRDGGHFNPDWAVEHAGFIDATLGVRTR